MKVDPATFTVRAWRSTHTEHVLIPPQAETKSHIDSTLRHCLRAVIKPDGTSQTPCSTVITTGRCLCSIVLPYGMHWASLCLL